MKKGTKRGLLAFTVLSAAVMVSGLGASASAAWRSVSDTYNYLSTPTFSLAIVEDYAAPEMGASPGMEIKKEVMVENTGSVPAFVRVRLEKTLGGSEALDPEQIVLDTNEEDWRYDKNGDWFYYNKVLAAGATTEPVLYGFALDTAAGNAYQLKDGAITVTAESLQNTPDALSTWGVTYEDLGIDAPNAWTKGITTRITFLSPEQEFDIETAKTDLFANFKDLLPGEKRTQEIAVKNAYDKDVTMYLTCMEGSQKPQEGSALYDLLYRYATITITDADGNTLYSGPVAGDGACQIGLGTFAAGEEKTLTVSLAVSPDMGTDACNLLGEVRWEVMADEVVTSLVQTGDLFAPGLAVFLGGAVCTGLGIMLLKRKETQEEAAI